MADSEHEPHETSEGVVGIFLAIALIVMVFAFMIILVG
jgi:hypothetical protein